MSVSTSGTAKILNVAKLVVSQKGIEVGEFPIDKRRLTIGRKNDCDIRIRCKTASRHHAQIFTVLEDDYILDLDSMNGTYVNRKRIKKHTLAHGDVITIGSHQLRYLREEGE